jgi:formamidopyrimidine-DNA glycosylase
VPELPEVDRVRRQLEPAMAGARFRQVVLRRNGLRQPFPEKLAARLRGLKVESLTRRGKYLLAALSSGGTLLMHLGMSGSLEVTRTNGRTNPPDADLDPHDHVIFEMSSGATITFNDPRRFGLLDLLPGVPESDGDPLMRLGPEPLSDAFDGGTLARVCAGRRTSLKTALLDQRVVAGLGNIYASEALNLAGLSPLRQASTIATRAGRPRVAADRLAAAIKSVLRRAIKRQADVHKRGARFRVYEREGQRCPAPGCGGTIRRVSQAGRSTFYCPLCQR